MSIEIDLSGKQAFVTGGTRGIGLEISKTLARAGADVVMGYRSDVESAGKALHEVKAAAPNIIAGIVEGDLGDPNGAASAAVNAWISSGGGVDIFVANAAVGGHGELAKTSLEDWRAPIEANLFGHVEMLRQLADKMRSGGSVIFISSGAGHDPLAGLSAYGVSKAAINQLAAILAQEWGPNGVRVNVVSPGHTAKQPVDYENLTDSQKSTIEGTALRRIGTPTDVANTVLFLASDLAGFVTGQWIRVNGGRV